MTSRFIIHTPKYNSQKMEAVFSYTMKQNGVIQRFIEKINFSTSEYSPVADDTNTIFALLQHISIALGISYYKTNPAETIEVEYCNLDKFQKGFWLTFYKQGLGEFFFVNELDPTVLREILGTGEEAISPTAFTSSIERHLLPFGGGKDSFVTASLLIQEAIDFVPFCFGKDYLIHKQGSTALDKQRLLIHRTLDLSGLKEAKYNGHVPITGIISFVSILVSYLYGFSHIDFSNEKSANFGNTEYKGMTINHQRSKSQEFETEFSLYIKKYISPDIQYSSRLRSMYEIAISKEFAAHKEYFSAFSSCNRNFSITKKADAKRCLECPKCMFVYMMLRPFLDQNSVDKIRGVELYEQNDLLGLCKEIRGVDGIKPLECVGTADESQLATYMYLRDNPDIDTQITAYFKQSIMNTRAEGEWKELEKSLLV